MEYGITCLVLAPPGFLPISESEYNEIRDAKRNIIALVAIEETFDFLVENYREYEHDLLDLTLNQLLSMTKTWESARSEVQRVNRRAANLLSAARSYLDQSSHHLKAIESVATGVFFEFDTQRKKQYEEKLGYRVMEEIRNYTQHRNFPIHSMGLPCSWEPPDERLNLVFRINPRLDLRELRGDSRIKNKVVEELEAIGESVNFTPLVSRVHGGLGRDS
jgi:hypothetical protein